jgi:hypothetical protein
MRALPLVALLCSVAAAAPPKPLPERAVRFTDEEAQLTASVEYPDAVDAALRRRLEGGLAVTFVARAYLFREGSARAEALAVQTARVAYDLWDEVYVVELSDERGRRVTREKGREAALARAASLDRLQIVPRARLTPGARYRLSVIVEVNPISPQLLKQVRRWLARPRGDDAVGASTFGALAGSFVEAQVSDAEKVLRFLSQPLVAP